MQVRWGSTWRGLVAAARPEQRIVWAGAEVRGLQRHEGLRRVQEPRVVQAAPILYVSSLAVKFRAV